MSLILLLLGLVTAAAGAVAVYIGSQITEFSIGTTLIVAGTVALVGGLILMGFAAVVNELRQVAEGLSTRIAQAVAAAQPQRTPPEAPVSRPADLGSATAAASVEASAAGFERLRLSLPRGERKAVEPSAVADGEEVPLSPTGIAHQPVQQANEPAPAQREPEVSGDDRAGAQAVEALKASRLDFLFRSRPLRPAQAANFDTMWPADAHSGRNADGQTQTRTAEATQETGTAPQVQGALIEPPLLEQGRVPAILKSGIVDGMPYTLYADGSIEAKLPQGTVRFGSISELRAHIESNS
jgi:hypothetical protein